jgi:hypothetical protein
VAITNTAEARNKSAAGSAPRRTIIRTPAIITPTTIKYIDTNSNRDVICSICAFRSSP